jgi:hypothetical protein
MTGDYYAALMEQRVAAVRTIEVELSAKTATGTSGYFFRQPDGEDKKDESRDCQNADPGPAQHSGKHAAET